MAVATKEKTKPTKTKPTPPRRSAMDVLDSVNEEFELAEEIGFTFESKDDPIGAKESAVFKRCGYITDQEQRAFISRCIRVRKFVERAGTKTEYDEATAKAADCKAAVENECPGLWDKIAKMQERIEQLEGDQAKADAVVVEYDRIRAALREPGLLPPHVRDDYNRSRGSINIDLMPDIGRLETKLNAIDKLPAMDHGSQEQLLYARNGCPECVEKHVVGNDSSRQYASYRVNPTAWENHVRDMQAQRPAIEQELRGLQAERQACLEDNAEILNYYLRKYDLI